MAPPNRSFFAIKALIISVIGSGPTKEGQPYVNPGGHSLGRTAFHRNRRRLLFRDLRRGEPGHTQQGGNRRPDDRVRRPRVVAAGPIRPARRRRHARVGQDSLPTVREAACVTRRHRSHGFRRRPRRLHPHVPPFHGGTM